MKLYIYTSNNTVVYVGITRQSIQKRAVAHHQIDGFNMRMFRCFFIDLGDCAYNIAEEVEGYFIDFFGTMKFLNNRRQEWEENVVMPFVEIPFKEYPLNKAQFTKKANPRIDNECVYDRFY